MLAYLWNYLILKKGKEMNIDKDGNIKDGDITTLKYI